MQGIPIIEIGIIGTIVLCGFLVYVMIIAPKKQSRKQETDLR